MSDAKTFLLPGLSLTCRFPKAEEAVKDPTLRTVLSVSSAAPSQPLSFYEAFGWQVKP